MCCMRTATRGTTVAQFMQSMRKAAPGSVRFSERVRVFDKRIVEGKAARFMAVSRSLAGGSRRERGEFRRRIHAARARLAARQAAWTERVVHQRRGAEPDPEFQSSRHDCGSLDGQRIGGQETCCALGG